jgi:hypothetical protein
LSAIRKRLGLCVGGEGNPHLHRRVPLAVLFNDPVRRPFAGGLGALQRIEATVAGYDAAGLLVDDDRVDEAEARDGVIDDVERVPLGSAGRARQL